jgi:hypothetical protein
MCIPKTSSLDVHILRCPCCKLNGLSKCTHPRATCPNNPNHRPYQFLPLPDPMSAPCLTSPSSPFPGCVLYDRLAHFFWMWVLQGLYSLQPVRYARGPWPVAPCPYPSRARHRCSHFYVAFSLPGGIPSRPRPRPSNAITAGLVAVGSPGPTISPISTHSTHSPIGQP